MLIIPPTVTPAAGALLAANNLTDLASAAAARAALDVAGKSEVMQQAITRALADYLYSDGATADRRCEATPGTVGAVGGQAINLLFEFDVPASNPSSNTELISIGPLSTGNASQNNALTLRLFTDGSFGLRQNGATFSSEYRTFQTANTFRSSYSGQRVRGVFVFASPNTATAPVVLLQGVDATSLFTAAGPGGVNWIPNTLDTTKFCFGLNFPAGRFISHAPILGALSNDDGLIWTLTGILPLWCAAGTGSAVPAYNSDFSAGIDSWANNGPSSTITGAETVAAVTNSLKIVNAGASAFQIHRLATVNLSQRYEITFDYYAETGSNLGYIGCGSSTLKRNTSNNLTVVEGAWQTEVKLIADQNLTAVNIGLFGATTAGGATQSTVAAGKIIAIKNVKVRILGPIAKWKVQPGPVADDLGQSGIILLLSPGINPITTEREFKLFAATYTNGNQQLLGQRCVPVGWRIAAVFARLQSGGTPTVTLGNVSGGAQIVASVAITSAAWKQLAIVSGGEITTTENLWANSNSTAVVYWAVLLERIASI